MTRTTFARYTIPSLAGLTLGGVVYQRVSLDELNLLTGILLLGAVSAGILLTFESAMAILRLSSDMRARVRLSVFTTALLLFAVELFLRFGLDRYSSYMERNGQPNYISIYTESTPSWFHTYGDVEKTTVPRPEFTHFRKINALGLAEREIDPEKGQDEYRIVALGDSFTEGVGASYESTWVKALERDLDARISNKTVTTVNAGISGSDLYFEYVLLKERLLSLAPDLVVVVMNSSDIEEPMVRGGMERFRPDGTTVYTKQPPSWEWLYGTSFIVRHVVHDLLNYDRYLMKRDETEARQIKAAKDIAVMIDGFEDLGRIHGFDLLFVAQPDAEELASNGYLYGFGNVVSELERRKDTNFIDLLAHYRTSKVMTEENVSEFYWKTDGHHNERGYEAMGLAISNKVWSMWSADDTD